MRPDPGVLTEIGVVKAPAIRIVVETKRARRERIGADKFAYFVVRGARERAHIEGQAPALRLAVIDGKVRVAQDKAADDICAARNRLKRQKFYILPSPLVLAGIEDRDSREISGCFSLA